MASWTAEAREHSIEHPEELYPTDEESEKLWVPARDPIGRSGKIV
jgi:hypothetical protein